VLRILALKRRSWRKGLILIAADFKQLAPFVQLPAGDLAVEALASWPGPHTWILPARSWIPDWLTGGRPTLAVRVTAHPVARALCEYAGQALVSTSANVSRRPPLKQAVLVRREFRREVDYILPGAVGESGRPTIIRDGRSGKVLRS
jgi:L-threonylcarbamoyladenylate synthase